jgi:hypothetical protein
MNGHTFLLFQAFLLFAFNLPSASKAEDFGDDQLLIYDNRNSSEDFPEIDCFRLMLHPHNDTFSLSTEIILDSSKHYPYIGEDEYHFRYQNLKKNDKFRLMGGVYEIVSVEKIPKDLKTRRTRVQTVLSLTKDKKIDVNDDSTYFIPLQILDKEPDFQKFTEINYVALHGYIACAYLDPKQSVKFKIQPGYVAEHLPPQTVEIGKEIAIFRHKHKVTQIVLPEPKKQLHGWIEIEQRPEDQP